MKPTDEQEAVLTAWHRHDGDQAITAYAGAGKTSTLKLLGRTAPFARGIYFVFNASAARDARGAFSDSVTVATAHAIARRAMRETHPWIEDRMNGARPRGAEVAKILGISGGQRISDTSVLSPAKVGRLAMDTVTRFCQSGDPQVGKHHVPRGYPGSESPEGYRNLQAIVLPYARKAWADLSHARGKLRFTHDCYLKLWSLSDPILPVDYVMLDEAQDTNGVVAHVMDLQRGHSHRLAVGDSNQAIYGWRGAADYMLTMDAEYRHPLTQSFRFGPAIAHEGNKWLRLLGNKLPLRGFDQVESTVAPVAAPHAVLCRTNAKAMETLIEQLGAGRQACLVGGGTEIRAFAEAADQLRDQHWTSHPELFGFTSWAMVQDYAENDHGGEDFKVLVDLVDKYTSEGLIRAIDASADPHRADVTISTAHKAKGGQWQTVRIAGDFRQPKPGPNGERGVPQRDAAMLAYVAVTRAQRVLDREGLAWVDEYLDVGTVAERNPWRPKDGALPTAEDIALFAKVAGELVDEGHTRPPAPAADLAVARAVQEAGGTPAEVMAAAMRDEPQLARIDLDDLPDVPLSALIGTGRKEQPE